MLRNLAPGCISSDDKLCQRKPLFPFFRGPLFWDPLFSFFCFFLALQRLARLKCNLEPNCKHIWGSLFSASPARSVLDFESFAGRGQMLDGRVLGASQVEYNPFGKPPLKRERSTFAPMETAWMLHSRTNTVPHHRKVKSQHCANGTSGCHSQTICLKAENP